MPITKPVLSADEAVRLIQDGQTVAIGGSGPGHSIPETLLEALGRRFRETGSPKGLTFVHAFGVGNQKDKGLEHVADPRLVRRCIGGHWSMSPSMARLAAQNELEAYCLPSGVIVHLMHATAAGCPGWLTEVGLGTFIDPRLEGGRLNEKAREELVKVVEVNGKEYLFYRAIPVDVALIRGTNADVEGNINMDEEVSPWHNMAMAQAAKASGGITIAQVKYRVDRRSLDPRSVRVPGIFVDCIVLAPHEGQTYQIDYDPSLCGDGWKPETDFPPFPLSLRKVIARRAAMELFPGAVLNVGFGVPDGVMKVAREQGIADEVVVTVEHGQVGGIPAEGLDFGASYNSKAIIETNHMFAFYNGRGVDLAFLGFAEVDREGNVNVSKLEDFVIGTGGFIDISQKARKVVFCGMLAVRAKEELAEGRVRVLQAGRPKFVEKVRQITFSGQRARQLGQEVLYVTELGVFRLSQEGVVLEEVAPGVDLERDIFAQMGFRPKVSEDLREMPRELFLEEKLPMKLFRHFQ